MESKIGVNQTQLMDRIALLLNNDGCIFLQLLQHAFIEEQSLRLPQINMTPINNISQQEHVVNMDTVFYLKSHFCEISDVFRSQNVSRVKMVYSLRLAFVPRNLFYDELPVKYRKTNIIFQNAFGTGSDKYIKTTRLHQIALLSACWNPSLKAFANRVQTC